MSAPRPSHPIPSSRPGTPPDPATSASHRLARSLEGVSDVRLTLLSALVLFVLAAWPLLLVEIPPFQDLPNHVATAYIIAHPDLYPQYVFSGLFKSNSLLTLWFYVLGGHGLYGAARAFTAVVLATGALALPLFVLRFAGRRALLVAMLLLWPLVHGFFVSMGMLNFSFAFALSLILLTVIDGQREHPTLGRGVAIAVLSGVLWYAHPFPLALVGCLVGLHVIRRPTWRERITASLTLISPLVPAALLTLVAAQQHLVKAQPAKAVASAAFSYLNPLEIVGHFWLDASGALTWWGAMTIVPAILLPTFAWKHRREDRPIYSNLALAILAAAYVALPVMVSNWWYLNCRFVPFLWVGLGLRLPTRLPRKALVALAACAVSFSVVLGMDYVKLDRDRTAFTAGMAAVPERATLLPLLFKKDKTSDFTSSLTHAWGYYTVERSTSAPLVFAVERSYPIQYRVFPPRALIPPALDRFAEEHGTPARVCKVHGLSPAEAACPAIWRDEWHAFWHEAEPHFSHVLTWAMPPEARPLIPNHYRLIFSAGELDIYARDTSARAASPK